MKLLRDYIDLALKEVRVREADVSGGRRVVWGSDEHVEDLRKRISELSSWRDKQKRGSETRANYSRLISRLKSELRSALKKRGENVDSA